MNAKEFNQIKKKFVECPEFPYFGAQYPDACCIEGTLHDMDNCDDEGLLYVNDNYEPCPFCKTREFLKVAKDNEEDIDKVRDNIISIYNRYARQPIGVITS